MDNHSHRVAGYSDLTTRYVHAVRSDFCQGIARDSVLSFGSSVRCGLCRMPEALDSVGASANGRRRRAPTGESVKQVRDVDGVGTCEVTAVLIGTKR